MAVGGHRGVPEGNGLHWQLPDAPHGALGEGAATSSTHMNPPCNCCCAMLHAPMLSAVGCIRAETATAAHDMPIAFRTVALAGADVH